MSIYPRYRQWLAVFFIALYAFIATPVQVWHHHTTSASTGVQSKAQHSPFDSISKKIQDQHHGHCSICAHQYAVFTEDSAFPVLAALPLSEGRYAPFCLSASTTLLHSFSNKGPPQA